MNDHQGSGPIVKQMPSGHRNFWIATFAVTAGCYFFFFLYLLSTSKVIKPLTQAISDVVEVQQFNQPIEAADRFAVYAYPGLAPGCRFLLFEALFSDCALVVVNVKEMSRSKVNALMLALQSPCSVPKQQSKADSQFRTYFRCESGQRRSYRIQLTVQTSETTRNQSGGSSTARTTIFEDVIEGK